jgi:hypothetical protein
VIARAPKVPPSVRLTRSTRLTSWQLVAEDYTHKSHRVNAEKVVYPGEWR